MAAALLTAWSQVSVPVQVQGWRNSRGMWRNHIVPWMRAPARRVGAAGERAWRPRASAAAPERDACFCLPGCTQPPRSCPREATLGRPSCFTSRREGGAHSGQRVGSRVAFLLEPWCPSGGSWRVLESGRFVLLQMPVTFEDVALYLSREEWGRLDHAQQNFYRDVLQKRNGLSLGKGRVVPEVGPSLPYLLLPFQGTKSFSPLLWTAPFHGTFLVEDVRSSCADVVATSPRARCGRSAREMWLELLFIYLFINFTLTSANLN